MTIDGEIELEEIDLDDDLTEREYELRLRRTNPFSDNPIYTMSLAVGCIALALGIIAFIFIFATWGHWFLYYMNYLLSGPIHIFPWINASHGTHGEIDKYHKTSVNMYILLTIYNIPSLVFTVISAIVANGKDDILARSKAVLGIVFTITSILLPLFFAIHLAIIVY